MISLLYHFQKLGLFHGFLIILAIVYF